LNAAFDAYEAFRAEAESLLNTDGNWQALSPEDKHTIRVDNGLLPVPRRPHAARLANFSRSGETRQDNDLVALRGASVCAGFEAKFDRAWARS
jgi:hypothetical protein